MNILVDEKEMKDIDSYSIHTAGIPSLELMERAAAAVADCVEQSIHVQDRILAVCGSGNNGGDGVAAARILKNRGYQADVLYCGSREHASAENREQIRRAELSGVAIYDNIALEEYTVIVDAVFGIGLSRPLEGKYRELAEQINGSGLPVFAVDIPSGIHGGSGLTLGTAIRATETITFGYEKTGLVLYPGREYAGKVTVADIGFSPEGEKRVNPACFTYGREDISRLPARPAYSNKGTFGRVLVIAGSKTISGAAYLSAAGAYRMGAGLVRVLTRPENRTILGTLLPEALLDTYENPVLEEQKILDALSWASAVVIGPGIGRDQTAEDLVELVISRVLVPIVIDADALYFLNGPIPDQAILTPHLKEMAALAGTSVQDIAGDLRGTAWRFTKNNGGILVLKDAATLVANGQRMYINKSGCSGMATGGSGDVLTGILAGLLAQGMEPFDAACLGVYLHGSAGEAAAGQKTEYCMMASDIIELLPRIIKESINQ